MDFQDNADVAVTADISNLENSVFERWCFVLVCVFGTFRLVFKFFKSSKTFKVVKLEDLLN